LVVGDETLAWRVGHRHRAEPGSPVYRDCTELLQVHRPGRRGQLEITFAPGPGRRVPSGGPDASGIVGTDADGSLNLHEPGTARAFIDEAAARGWRSDQPTRLELDGWDLFPAAAARRRSPEPPAPRG